MRPRGSGSVPLPDFIHMFQVCRSRSAQAVRCRVILMVAASALGGGSVRAQDTLGTVVVTGTREPQPLERSTADIVVIDADTIRRSSADSVEDLLRREAGIQITRNGGPGQNSGFFIRGASTNSTIVLVDGVRIGSATLGQAEFEAFNLAQVERIEVLRGPASSLYGADAVGGVVQIFTRRGVGEPRFSAAAAAGGYASRQGDVALSGSSRNVDYAVSVAGESSRGVSALRLGDAYGSFNPDRDGYSRGSAQLTLGVTPAPGHRVGIAAFETRLHSHFDGADFNPPAFMADPSADFQSRLTTRVTSTDYRGELTSAWTTTAQLSRSVDDLTSGGTTASRFVTRRSQMTWQNAFRIDASNQAVIAYEHLDERAAADGFASELARRNDAVVAGISAESGRHAMQADLRRDNNSAYGGDTTGRLGYSFEILSGLKLRGLAGTTFRAPTFNDLYYPNFGVPSLRPERGRSFEIGVVWKSGWSHGDVTLYRNRVRDLIGVESNVDAAGVSLGRCPAGDEFGCARNVGRARLQGASLAAAQRWGAFDLNLRAELLDARNADTGERLARRAAHQESVSLRYSVESWSAAVSSLVIGSRPDAGVVLGGYGTVDVKGTWRVRPGWQLEAKVLNALDHHVEPLRDFQGLGRQAWLGLRYDSAAL
jgi:vitamin B12 transporter